jgi:hypothetical protein
MTWRTDLSQSLGKRKKYLLCGAYQLKLVITTEANRRSCSLIILWIFSVWIKMYSLSLLEPGCLVKERDKFLSWPVPSSPSIKSLIGSQRVREENSPHKMLP